MPGCTSDQQLDLLVRVQELLRESRYTTTYKFALLHAMCDLALEMSPEQSTMRLDAVAHRVISLYWRQVREFHPPRSDLVVALRQSTSGTAAAVNLVSSMHRRREYSNRAEYGARSPSDAREMLVVLKKDVLRRLQPVERPFIYRIPVGRSDLELCPGVAETMRRFHGLLTDMIQARWTAWIEQRNPAIAGSDALREHLFGVDRQSLRMVVEPMLEIQKGRCFYSGADITTKSAQVDHFLPWSRTHNNSVGNLVLATQAANSKKSDRLPTAESLVAWERRNDDHALALRAIADAHHLLWDPVALKAVTRWLMRAG